MRMINVVVGRGGDGSDGRSGLTGPADIGGVSTGPDVPDGAGAPAGRGLVAWVLSAGAQVRATVAGLPRVLGLSWRAAPRLTVGLGVATAVGGLVPAATAAIVRLIVNVVAASIHDRHAPVVLPLAGLAHAPPVAPATAIAILVTTQLLVTGLSVTAAAASDACTQLLQDRLMLSIQAQVMAKASELDLAFFEDPASYDLLRQSAQEVPTRPISMINSAFTLVQTSITLMTMIGLLVTLGPIFALIALVAPVPGFISQVKYGKRGYLVSLLTSPARRRMQYLNDLVATDTYVKEVKLFGLAPFLMERFSKIADAFYASQQRLISRRHIAGAAWSSVSALAGAATYGYVALAALSGRLTIGDMTLYTAAAISVQTSVQGVFQAITGMYENNLYLDILGRLMAARAQITAPAVPAPVARRAGRIVFDHVTFSYPGRGLVLDDVCLEIPAGQTVALVGRNGAGKSTVIKLLCRLHDPDSGRITLDGVDLRELNPAELRSGIGAVFQDHVTYQATAGENIGLGDVRRIEDEAGIAAAAADAGAAELIAELPHGYQTPLGKWFAQGVSLSGGQRQAIALGRAFMRDAPLLILDEPSAALDIHAEHDLFGRLRKLASGKTTVFVSHRFSTVRQADRIFVLENGKVAEEGTHDELMAVGGSYAAMFTLQADSYLDATEGG